MIDLGDSCVLNDDLFIIFIPGFFKMHPLAISPLRGLL